MQALPSQRRMARFHMRMVRRRAWSRAVDGDRVVRGPAVHSLTPELTPVVTEAPPRRASMDVAPSQHRHDVRAAKTLAHLNGHTLARIHSAAGAGAKSAPLDQWIRHTVS